MGFLDFLGVGKAAGQAVGEISDAGIRLVNAVKGKDPELEKAAMELFGKVNEAQSRINEENAKLGRGSWRNAMGWVGVYALGYNYIFAPTATALGLKIPAIDMTEIIGLAVILLGGAGIKVAEKKIMQ